MAKKHSVGVRLAIRREGQCVNAYLATEASMDGAMLLGSMLLGIVDQNPDIWEAWKGLMAETLTRAIKQKFGQTPEMTERAAPEHEKSGRA